MQKIFITSVDRINSTNYLTASICSKSTNYLTSAFKKNLFRDKYDKNIPLSPEETKVVNDELALLALLDCITENEAIKIKYDWFTSVFNVSKETVYRYIHDLSITQREFLVTPFTQLAQAKEDTRYGNISILAQGINVYDEIPCAVNTNHTTLTKLRNELTPGYSINYTEILKVKADNIDKNLLALITKNIVNTTKISELTKNELEIMYSYMIKLTDKDEITKAVSKALGKQLDVNEVAPYYLNYLAPGTPFRTQIEEYKRFIDALYYTPRELPTATAPVAPSIPSNSPIQLSTPLIDNEALQDMSAQDKKKRGNVQCFQKYEDEIIRNYVYSLFEAGNSIDDAIVKYNRNPPKNVRPQNKILHGGTARRLHTKWINYYVEKHKLDWKKFYEPSRVNKNYKTEKDKRRAISNVIIYAKKNAIIEYFVKNGMPLTDKRSMKI